MVVYAQAIRLLLACKRSSLRRKTRHALRYAGLNSNDIWNIRKLKKQILLLSLIRNRQRVLDVSLENRETVDSLLKILCLKWANSVRIKDQNVEAIIHKNITIAEFEAQPEICERDLRFKSTELRELFDSFQIPRVVLMDNRCKFSGEEIFLFSLNRYAYPKRYCDQQSMFGRESTQWSRAFAWFNKHIYTTFSHLLMNNLPYWQQYFDTFADGVEHKMNHYGLHYPEGTRNTVIGYIDNTMRRICRAGSGPATERQAGGPVDEGDRNDTLIQRSFYSGYKHIHALKWQTVSWPNGMIGDMWGPISGRLSDLDTLRLSQINTRLRDLQVDHADQFKLYGDAIYPVMTHLRKRHQNRPNTAAQIRENNVMKKLRITIEWDYGNTVNLFKYVNFHENGKVLLSGGSNIPP